MIDAFDLNSDPAFLVFHSKCNTDSLWYRYPASTVDFDCRFFGHCLYTKSGEIKDKPRYGDLIRYPISGYGVEPLGAFGTMSAVSTQNDANKAPPLPRRSLAFLFSVIYTDCCNGVILDC